MSALISAEIVAGALILLALGTLAFIFLRRRMLAKDLPLMLCAVRRNGKTHWRLGLVRFGSGTLAWFSLVGPSMRAKRTWDRPRLDVGPPRPVREPIAGLPDAVGMRCHHDGEDFELAMMPAAYMAMRSWLESAPPGFNVNVA